MGLLHILLSKRHYFNEDIKLEGLTFQEGSFTRNVTLKKLNTDEQMETKFRGFDYMSTKNKFVLRAALDHITKRNNIWKYIQSSSVSTIV